MIALIIYFLLICFLIYKTGLFGILKDDTLNSKFYLSAFIIKCLGIVIVGWIYQKLYGTSNYLDAANFFNDSRVIHNIASSDFSQFLKVMFGLHDESPSSDLYKNFLVQTTVWDKNPEEFLYNDNRIVLRLHALIHFISFNNYFVHALFSVLIALIGINLIYKTFKFLFRGKEIFLFLCWLIFPGLLFWTSGLFKEAPTVFVMGILLFSMKKVIIERDFKLSVVLTFLFCAFISFLLKPYILVPVLLLSLLFFCMYSFKKQGKISLLFISSCLALLVLGNFVLQAITSQSILSLVSKRQFTFVDMSRGGLFLLNDSRYVRLPYDYSKIDTLDGKEKIKIKSGASFIFWEHSHQQDTLMEVNNTDTSSLYKLYNIIPPAKSALNITLLNNSYVLLVKTLPYALYITLFKPFFFDARNAMDLLASFENFIILISLFIVLLSGFRNPWLIYFLTIVFSVLIITGLTSPNMGAIERYRSLVIPFLLTASLLNITLERFEQNRVFMFFKRPSKS